MDKIRKTQMLIEVGEKYPKKETRSPLNLDGNPFSIIIFSICFK
jgi:hypothetical protein